MSLAYWRSYCISQSTDMKFCLNPHPKRMHEDPSVHALENQDLGFAGRADLRCDFSAWNTPGIVDSLLIYLAFCG